MLSTGDVSFAQKVQTQDRVVIYELLPPPKNLTKKKLESLISSFARKARKYPIDAVNLPEVREETRKGARRLPKVVKVEPRKLVFSLQEHTRLPVIINRPVVYLPWDKQVKWLGETYRKYSVRNFILVGGESNKIFYPGASVVEAARAVTGQLHARFPDVFLGGITIPTRRNEAKRLLKKSQAGIEYFTSQIIYEPEGIKRVLADYHLLCKRGKVRPKMIFLSFAPVSKEGDLELLAWLGVEFGKHLKRQLSGSSSQAEHSIQICQTLLKDILGFSKKQKLEVPLGLNVEHITRSNFDLSFELLENLLEVYLPKGYNTQSQ